MLRLTFTGIDEWTDLAELPVLADIDAEYAVLAGTSTGRHPRFPRTEFIRDIAEACREAGTRSAIHLCGVLARRANAGEHDEIAALCRGFGRVQVNSPAPGDYAQENLERLHDLLAVPVIVQHREPFGASEPFAGPVVSYLFDRSGGRGIVGLDNWSAPWPKISCGYAGGLNAENITAAATLVQSFDENVWLDMESGIRTGDRLDVEKIRAVAEKALDTPTARASS